MGGHANALPITIYKKDAKFPLSKSNYQIVIGKQICEKLQNLFYYLKGYNYNYYFGKQRTFNDITVYPS